MGDINLAFFPIALGRHALLQLVTHPVWLRHPRLDLILFFYQDLPFFRHIELIMDLSLCSTRTRRMSAYLSDCDDVNRTLDLGHHGFTLGLSAASKRFLPRGNLVIISAGGDTTGMESSQGQTGCPARQGLSTTCLLAAPSPQAYRRPKSRPCIWTDAMDQFTGQRGTDLDFLPPRGRDFPCQVMRRGSRSLRQRFHQSLGSRPCSTTRRPTDGRPMD